MSVLDWLLGRRLSSLEEEHQHIGPSAGIPILGLDALSSAAYGPEAALTLLIPLGAAGLGYALPILAIICAILVIVFFSYRQTISAYPNGGGSYTVAKENLGAYPGLLAGAALAIDYVLNVAVGISAGVGALVSAFPDLLPHTLALCIGILVFISIVNLRGIKESGAMFMVPTYAFVGALGIVIVIGIVKSIAAGGTPEPVETPPGMPTAVEAASAWILLKAFASGCTAMTGIEAVSNAVPIFRKPTIPLAQRTLTAIIAILIALLAGIGYVCRTYHIGATDPGAVGYQSVLSMMIAAVAGRGVFYYAAMGAIVAVLALSANTSFAGFPRLCRLLADDRYLPGTFAERGRRLVFSSGIIVLAVLAGALLLAFGGITDKLIPLFAIGAFLAFTLSQAGMVVHWMRVGGANAHRNILLNGAGALATGVTLVVVSVSKFGEGAWVTIVVVPLLVLFFVRINHHYRKVGVQVATIEPMEMPDRVDPVVVLAAGSWNKMTLQGLKFALRLSDDIYVVQVKTETSTIEDLSDNWELLIANPARRNRIAQPKLVILTSQYREFLNPFVEFVKKLEGEHADRDIAVVIPDLIVAHWYEGALHNNRGTFLRMLLRAQCSDRVVVINTPFHLHD
ncbi:MAG TPA: APC family permease [Kofleriaceae bacterium]|nr:APC family permease [Kofleriaceae bacterium]